MDRKVFVTNNKSVAKFTKFDFIQSLNININSTQNYKNEISENKNTFTFESFTHYGSTARKQETKRKITN